MDSVILLDSRGQRHIVPLEPGVVRVSDLGTVDASKLRERLGRKISIGSRSFLVLDPSMRDLRETMERGPQTLAPKDLASILYEADIRPGGRVVEGGAGSGALACALARAVGPGGHVYSYDLREESLAVARRNAAAAAVQDRVDFRVGDLREPMAETAVDAVVLDIPDPWAAVPSAWEALRPCGSLATFSPNMEQVKETVTAIRKNLFVDVRTIELIEREMEVRDVGVRPSFAALGHTGYLTFARKVLDTF